MAPKLRNRGHCIGLRKSATIADQAAQGNQGDGCCGRQIQDESDEHTPQRWRRAKQREERVGSLFKLRLTTACRKSEGTKEYAVGREERSVLRRFSTGKLLPQRPKGLPEEQPLLAELLA